MYNYLQLNCYCVQNSEILVIFDELNALKTSDLSKLNNEPYLHPSTYSCANNSIHDPINIIKDRIYHCKHLI